MGFELDNSVLNQLGSPAIWSSDFADFPAPGYTGRLLVAIDTLELYRDTGSGFDLIGGPGVGTITGTGTPGAIPLFTGAQVIGDSALTEAGGNVTASGNFTAAALFASGATLSGLTPAGIVMNNVAGVLSTSTALPNGVTATTQAPGNNSDLVATTAFVAASSPAGAALTRADDTNVTLTLGGTPSTAVLQAVSLTMGWTGTLAVARGGIGTGSAGITAINNITGQAYVGFTGALGGNLVGSASPTFTGTAIFSNLLANFSSSGAATAPIALSNQGGNVAGTEVRENYSVRTTNSPTLQIANISAGSGLTADTTLAIRLYSAASGAASLQNNMEIDASGNVKFNYATQMTVRSTNRVLTFPDANGTIALTSDIPAAGVTTMAAVGSAPNANAASISGVTLTMQPASGSFPGVVTTGSQTLAGFKSFSDGIDVAGGGVRLATSGGANVIYWQSPQNSYGPANDSGLINFMGAASVNFFLLQYRDGSTDKGAEFFLPVFEGVADPYEFTFPAANGTIALTSDIPAAGVTTMAAVGSSPNANAASISGVTLTMQPASGSFPGVVTTGTQTFAGDKTFSGSAGIVVANGVNLDILSSVDGGTNSKTMILQNTTGQARFGVAGSTGYFGVGTAYYQIMVSSQGIGLIVDNNVLAYEVNSSGNHDFQSGTALFGSAVTSAGTGTTKGFAWDNFQMYQSAGTALIVANPGGYGDMIEMRTAGELVFRSPIWNQLPMGLKSYTVATLPSASGLEAFIAVVSDALTPTYGAVVTGGGSDRIIVLSNGTNWLCH